MCIRDRGEPPASDPIEVMHKVNAGTWTFEHVADPRWRLLLEGLLTQEPDDRWGSAQVHAWLAGESPEVVRRTRPTGATETQRVVGTFFFGGAEHAEPASLAAALGAHWDDACDLLVSRRLADLRTWLGKTRIGDAADTLIANIRDGATTPQRGAVELQAMLDPASAPVFLNVRLDAAGFQRVALAADRGEDWAMGWVRGLRSEAILSVLGNHGWTDFARAGDQLARWWREMATTRKALEADPVTEPLIGRSETAAESTLLLGALDAEYAESARLAAWERLTNSGLDYPQVVRLVDQRSLPQVLRAVVLAEEINRARELERRRIAEVAAEQQRVADEQAALAQQRQREAEERERQRQQEAEQRERDMRLERERQARVAARRTARGRIVGRLVLGAVFMAIILLIYQWLFGYAFVDFAVEAAAYLLAAVGISLVADLIFPLGRPLPAVTFALSVALYRLISVIALHIMTGARNPSPLLTLPLWFAVPYVGGMALTGLLARADGSTTGTRRESGWLHLLPVCALAVMAGTALVMWVGPGLLFGDLPAWLAIGLNPLGRPLNVDLMGASVLIPGLIVTGLAALAVSGLRHIFAR